MCNCSRINAIVKTADCWSSTIAAFFLRRTYYANAESRMFEIRVRFAFRITSTANWLRPIHDLFVSICSSAWQSTKWCKHIKRSPMMAHQKRTQQQSRQPLKNFLEQHVLLVFSILFSRQFQCFSDCSATVNRAKRDDRYCVIQRTTRTPFPIVIALQSTKRSH